MTDAQHFTAARSNAAAELSHAGSLRRDFGAGRIHAPKAVVVSVILDCLRHARQCRAKAAIIRRAV